jgi:hypothetical protein
MTLALARRAGLPALAAVLLLTAAPARACNVPVFRYALERWPADPYEVIVFHRGPLSPADTALADALAKLADADAPIANFTFERVDLEKKPDKELVRLFESLPDKDNLPLLVVCYPAPSGISANAWSGRLSTDAVRRLLDSPARREVVRRIVGGDSGVWILLECGDRGQDDAAEKLLRAELLKLQQTLKLPELTADPEDKLSGKGPELKLSFSLVRVSRSDPAEKMLVAMLERLEENLPADKPMAFAVFGRGRALPPTIGRGINPDTLRADARFLTGPCTCKVKEQNPGVDLLIVADWEAPVTRQPTITLPGEPSSVTLPAQGAPPAPRSEAAAEVGSSPLLMRNLLLAGAGGLVLVGALTFLLMRKNKGWG